MLRRGVMAVRGQAETRLKLGAAGAAGLLLFLALVHLKLYLYRSSNLYLFSNLLHIIHIYICICLHICICICICAYNRYMKPGEHFNPGWRSCGLAVKPRPRGGWSSSGTFSHIFLFVSFFSDSMLRWALISIQECPLWLFTVAHISHQVFAEFQENPRTRRSNGGGARAWKQCPGGKNLIPCDFWLGRVHTETEIFLRQRLPWVNLEVQQKKAQWCNL